MDAVFSGSFFERFIHFGQGIDTSFFCLKNEYESSFLYSSIDSSERSENNSRQRDL